jgi:hypothetical protein
MPSQKLLVSPAQPPKTVAQMDLAALLGPPALLEGEDSTTYHELSARFRSAVVPQDVIEEMWLRDIVDLIWETMRLRRLKSKLLRAAAHEGLAKVLTPLISAVDLREIVNGWSRRDTAAMKTVAELLEKAELDQDSIAAQTFAVKLETFDRIDALISRTEARRNLVLREIDRHRNVLVQRLREAANEIEDAQFSEVAPATKKAIE